MVGSRFGKSSTVGLTRAPNYNSDNTNLSELTPVSPSRNPTRNLLSMAGIPSILASSICFFNFFDPHFHIIFFYRRNSSLKSLDRSSDIWVPNFFFR